MIGTPSLPPGLRFPSGDVVARHFVLMGTQLAPRPEDDCFVIWALDLGEEGSAGVAKREDEVLEWQELCSGRRLGEGSWNRGVVWGERNCVVVLGDPTRDARAFLLEPRRKEC